MSPSHLQTRIEDNGFRNLLFFLLLYIFGSPFLSAHPSLAVIIHGSLTITLCASVYAVQKRQNYRTFAMILLIPVVVLYWLGLYEIIPFGRTVSYCLLVIYFGLLILSFAAQISKFDRVTLQVLYATLCLYLIIGLFWGALYALVYDMSPDAFGGALLENYQDGDYYIFTYFSIVTLTTLGYGDITPQSMGAASLCQLEAVIGQFFTAVVIAWLVGNFISEKKETKTPPSTSTPPIKQ